MVSEEVGVLGLSDKELGITQQYLISLFSEKSLSKEDISQRLKEITGKNEWGVNPKLEEMENRAVKYLLALDFNPQEIFKTIRGRILNKQAADRINTAFGLFTDFLKMAEGFLDLQPIYYDNNKLWFAWDHEEYCYVPTDETNILNQLDRHIANTQATISLKTKSEILESIRRRARQREPKKPLNTWVQFKDKVIDIKTGESWEATPEYFFTCPVPHELGNTEETPILDKLIREWVVGGEQDESYIQTMYEIMAYSILQDQFLQRLFAFTGTGSNGKGCFLRVLVKLIGERNVTTTEIKQLAKNNFEASALYKKQAAIMGEVDVYDLSNTNLLKKLTGEDLIRYEFKGKTPFSENSFCTCFVATNSLPITPDKSIGFYRRWLLVEFPHEFKTGKDIIGDLPEEEYCNLCLKLVKIAKGLYDKKEFTNEGNFQNRKERYEERSNPIVHFISNFCKDTIGEDTRFSEFYRDFIMYLREHRIREITKRQTSKMLKQEGYIVEKGNYDREDGTRSKALFIQDLVLLYKLRPVETQKNQESSSIPIKEMNRKHGSYGSHGSQEVSSVQNPNQTFINPIIEKIEDFGNFEDWSYIKIKLLELIKHKGKYPIQKLIDRYGSGFVDKMIQDGEVMENPAGFLQVL